jgi:hypothetical protein
MGVHLERAAFSDGLESCRATRGVPGGGWRNAVFAAVNRSCRSTLLQDQQRMVNHRETAVYGRRGPFVIHSSIASVIFASEPGIFTK